MLSNARCTLCPTSSLDRPWPSASCQVAAKKGLAQRLVTPAPESFKRVSGYGLGDALSRFNPMLRSMSVT